MKKKIVLIATVLLIIVLIVIICIYKKTTYKNIDEYLYEENLEYIQKNNIIDYKFDLLMDGYTCYSEKIKFYDKECDLIYIRYLESSNKGPLRNTVRVELGNIDEINIEENIENLNNYCKNALNYSEELKTSIYFYNKSNDKDIYENLKNGEILIYNNFDNNQKIYQIAYYKQGDKLIGEFSYCGITTKNEEVVDEGIGEH